jgi:UDP-2-acetamido-2,6-beta-L-arabino-hexul-4-ose reductase
MKVLVTGANGFVGQNLVSHLNIKADIEILHFTRNDSIADLPDLIRQADFVFHLAGINRPLDPLDFQKGNTDLTRVVCDAIRQSGRLVPVVYTSSSQATLGNAYGTSKLDAEKLLIDLKHETGSPVHIFRLPNVFGKWARPNYNSAVATFCYNIAHGLPITINDAAAPIRLVYIDDVILCFMDVLEGRAEGTPFIDVLPQYDTTVGALSDQLKSFRDSRETMVSERVGTGLPRALYSTYLSYLSPDRFTYTVPMHADPRGAFVEMLKTKDSGQFSYFTAHPGITRGGHYHHSKTEKFLVIKGQACFRFRHIVSGEFYELYTDGETPQIVETVPGWSHDITNIGETEMIVMLWANEIFDRERPDTYTMAVGTQA